MGKPKSKSKRKANKPRIRKELLPWRFWSDEQLLGRDTFMWTAAESLRPGPRTIQDAADGSLRARAVTESYRLLITPTVVTAEEFAAMCTVGGEGVAFEA
jgi:hypothetical protein